MPSRRACLVTTGIFTTQFLAGCGSLESGSADSEGNSTVAIENRADESVTVEVTISEVEGDEQFAETYRVTDGTTQRADTFDLGTGEYRIFVSLEDGGATKRWFTVNDAADMEGDPPIHVIVDEDGEIYIFGPDVRQDPPPQPIDPDTYPDISIWNRRETDVEVSVEVRDASTSDTLRSETVTIAAGERRGFDIDADGTLELLVETPEHGKATFELDGDRLAAPGHIFDVTLRVDDITGGPAAVN